MEILLKLGFLNLEVLMAIWMMEYPKSAELCPCQANSVFKFNVSETLQLIKFPLTPNNLSKESEILVTKTKRNIVNKLASVCHIPV